MPTNEFILKTKLQFPYTLEEAIPRTRLWNTLGDSSSIKPLSVISAPAGFGKTTLMTSWLKQIDLPIAWFSLDEGDNEPGYFLRHFVAALQSVDKDIAWETSERISNTLPPKIDVLLPEILHAIEISTIKFVLVLDDFHLIKNPNIHTFVQGLVTHTPENFKLGITSRESIPFALSRQRLRGLMQEITDTDLRFSQDEAKIFLNRIMNIEVDEKTLNLLNERTEGWIAGIQLAALSMQGDKNYFEFVESFKGDDHLVMNYMVEEVLSQQSDELKHFLLSTAVLSRLNAALCNQVAEITNSQAILTQLDKANMFLVALDNTRTWFRYHHLFGDLLLAQIKNTQPEKIVQLHQRASDWYLSEKMYEDAANHAFKVDDFQRALIILGACGRKLFADGQLAILFRWYEKLPDSLVEVHPFAFMLKAMVYLIGAGKPVLAMLEKIDALIKQCKIDKTISEADIKEITGLSMTLRSYMYLNGENHEKALALTQRAMEYYDKDDAKLFSYAYVNIAAANMGLGHIDTAEAFDKSYSHSIKHKISISLAHAVAGKINYYFMLGELNTAQKITEHWIPKAQTICRHEPRFSFAYYANAALSWEKNLVTSSTEQLTQGFQFAELDAAATNLAFGLAIYGYQLAKLGDKENEKIIHQRFQNLDDCPPLVPLLNPLEAYRAKWLLARGDIDEVSLWIEKKDFDNMKDYSPYQEMNYLIYARYLSIMGNHQKAIRYTANIIAHTEKGNRLRAALEARVIQLLARKMMGDTSAALEGLQLILEKTSDQPFYRLFLDEGPLMAGLLKKLTKKEQCKSRIHTLLPLFQNGASNETTQQSLSNNQVSNNKLHHLQGLKEPFTKKENIILELLVAGLTNDEIAEKTFVSRNTVKTHVRNIYQKLDVKNRNHAIIKVKDLNLV